jgi:hypothetical protein
LRHLISKHGFVIDEQIKTLPDVSVLFQLAIAYLYKVTVTRSRVFNLLITAALMAPIAIVGLALRVLLPRNADLYLDNVIVAQKPSASA